MGELVLLAIVAAMGGWPQAAGAREPQWAQEGAPMWCYLCWVPPVVCARPKWRCAATGGHGGTAALLAIVAAMGGWPQAASVGGHQWGPKGTTRWHYLCWVLTVGHTRPNWQCVAARGQGWGQHPSLVLAPQVVLPR